MASSWRLVLTLSAPLHYFWYNATYARNGNMGRDPAVLEGNQTKALRAGCLLR